MVGYRYTPPEYNVFEVPKETTLTKNTERSEWHCYLFGDYDEEGPGRIVFVPAKGKEPCWFHRKMQELCFGIQWRKPK